MFEKIVNQFESLRELKLKELGKSVCRIVCNSKTFDLKRPFNTSQDDRGTGTGFLIEDPNRLLIVTAHHVVSNHVSIDVFFDTVSHGQHFEARMVACNPHLDVALLTLVKLEPAEEDMFKQLRKFSPGNSDKIRQRSAVSAMGYALGDVHLQSSSGSVSGRIYDPNRLQTDTPVNPGNSGGPMIDSRADVIGIVTSGVDGAQNINYATPFAEILLLRTKMEASSDSPYIDMGMSLNCVFRNMSENTMKNERGEFCRSGVIVADVHRHSDTCLEKKDVICAIQYGGEFYDVDMQGNIMVSAIWQDTKLDFRCILDRVAFGQTTIKLRILRDSNIYEIDANLSTNKCEYRELYPDLEPYPYFVFGGLVLQMLNPDTARLHPQLQSFFNRSPKMVLYSMIMCTAIAAGSPFSRIDLISPGSFLVALHCEDRRYRLRSLTCLAKHMDAISSGRVTLETFDGNLLTVNGADATAFDTSNGIKTGIHLEAFPPRSPDFSTTQCRYSGALQGTRLFLTPGTFQPSNFWDITVTQTPSSANQVQTENRKIVSKTPRIYAEYNLPIGITLSSVDVQFSPTMVTHILSSVIGQTFTLIAEVPTEREIPLLIPGSMRHEYERRSNIVTHIPTNLNNTIETYIENHKDGVVVVSPNIFGKIQVEYQLEDIIWIRVPKVKDQIFHEFWENDFEFDKNSGHHLKRNVLTGEVRQYSHKRERDNNDEPKNVMIPASDEFLMCQVYRLLKEFYSSEVQIGITQSEVPGRFFQHLHLTLPPSVNRPGIPQVVTQDRLISYLNTIMKNRDSRDVVFKLLTSELILHLT
jgi:S1-C subfamily serine protease